MTIDRRRCAVYTRKSSEEGLSQRYNSLHAQRESCEAYARSQAGEGWVVARDRYDDGGHSGATMKRPALQRLLADAAASKIDIVLVYKVDRLTRSLSDFARIIEAFDKAHVSFVSVTQAFNTTSSMGRLTLNVLLSFAQFEREVTGERIRDKIAASKAKGMWMGGLVPLGYNRPADRCSRTLQVNEDEARAVRCIFNRFLALGSLSLLQEWLVREGIRSKARMSPHGRAIGDVNFSRGALRHLLTNRIYLGQIVHKGAVFAGRHPAILDQDVFDAAQHVLAANAHRRRSHVSKARKALLYNLVFDADGQLLTSRFSCGRKGRRYHYYVAPPPWPGAVAEQDLDTIRSVPGPAIESLVRGRVTALVPEADAADVRRIVRRVEVHATAVHMLLNGRELSGGRAIQLDELRPRLPAGDQLLAEPSRVGVVRLVLPVRMKIRGGRTWRSDASGTGPPPRLSVDITALKRLRAAHAGLRACGAHPDCAFITLHHARAPASLGSVRWAFLAPDIQRSLLDGRLTWADMRPLMNNLPLSWSEQCRLIGALDVGAVGGQSSAQLVSIH
jgi:DNA invertase Pin-like site-specific DNA recombinase